MKSISCSELANNARLNWLLFQFAITNKTRVDIIDGESCAATQIESDRLSAIAGLRHVTPTGRPRSRMSRCSADVGQWCDWASDATRGDQWRRSFRAMVPSRPTLFHTTGCRGRPLTFFPVQDFYLAMPHDLVTPDELEVGVTELRDSLGFTVRHVAESGTPVVVRRYRRAEVILVPLAEWRRLKQLEADLGGPTDSTLTTNSDPISQGN